MNNIGVIIKIQGNEAIVMTDDCSFKKIKKKSGMFPGQKILVPNDEMERSGSKRIKQALAVMASIAAVFLVFISLMWVNRLNDIYAYIDVDINPSLNFSIDRHGKIKALNPLNDEAQELIRGVEFEGMLFTEAFAQVIELSKAQGIIDENKTNYVLVCAVLNYNYNAKEGDRLLAEAELEELLDSIRADIDRTYGGIIQPETVKVPFEYRTMSEENHISMGRYLTYRKLEDMGVELSIEQLKSVGIDEILKQYNLDFAELTGVEYDKTQDEAAPTSESPAAPTTNKPESPETTLEAIFTPANTPANTPITSSKPAITPTESSIPKLTPTPALTSTPIPTLKDDHTKATPTSTPTAKNGTGSGLRGEYYSNMDLTLFQFARIDPCINFDWGEGTPDQSIAKDTYSVRWIGKIEPRYSETYTFYTSTDDGVRLWVNGVLLIDQWKSQSATEHSGQITLEAGRKYDIKMEYYQHVRDASAKLMWSSMSQEKEIIPSSQLYPSDGPLPQKAVNGLNAEYYGDMDLKDKRFSQIDEVINFSWGRELPVSELKDNKFSVRWVGKIDARYTEEYTFHALSDDGVRVWINNVLIIDNWKKQENEVESTGKIELKAGRQYDIKIEYYNYGGPASMKLLWSSRRQKKEVVPTKNLYAN
ncbi:MAG TPA: anti-sigma factor domain-containing protein [Clostridium sp.]|uniref:Anti-sigma factor domain-containing protein n=2 Tax=Acetivibrio mesophilus TaxID=2487273 RepID=A0A4Q0I5M9_9FIRM|nr:anti-sigma factor domain-containing protein [Acetivibrio mesophilus]HHV30531.1 anti-sigma factor domain-containing protein [Clostridium sp.]